MKINSVITVSFLAVLIASVQAAAWDRGTVAYEGGPGVVISPLIPDSSHLLSSDREGPLLRLRITNKLDRELKGAFIYAGITDFQGRGCQDFNLRLDLPVSGSLELDLKADSLSGKAGFYDMRVLAFDKGRELGGREFTFGLDVDKIDTPPHRPENFDRFWQATLDSLHSAPLEAECIKEDSLCTPEALVWRVSYRSLHGVKVHGWLTTPARGNGPFAAFLALPGYGTGLVRPNTYFASHGWACLSIQVSGYESGRAEHPQDDSQYMTIGIDSPETWVFREIVCHCLRGIDFLASRPEIDSLRLGVTGGSQGGGLSLLTAGLDRRVRAVSAGVPFLTNFPLSMTMTGNPFREVVRYIEQHPDRKTRVLRTVSYADVLNFADRITAPALVSAGLFDRTCPAPAIYGMFLRLASKDKEIRLYPWLDHLEVHGSHKDYEQKWFVRHLPPSIN